MNSSNNQDNQKNYQAKFPSFDLAEADAIKMSQELRHPLHVVASSDLYWVNSNTELLEWERMCASYENGNKVSSYL